MTTAAVGFPIARIRRVLRSAAPFGVALWLAGCASQNYGGPINGQQALSPEERRLQAVETKLTELGRRLDASEAGQQTRSAAEVGELRGEIEQLRHDLDQVLRRSNEVITSFDARIKGLETTAFAQGLSAPAGGFADPTAIAPDGDAQPTPAPSVTVPSAAGAPLSSAADEEALYLSSFDLLKGGRYDDAIAGFKGMLAKYPQGNYSDNGWYWTAESYYIKKDYPNALEHYRGLLEKFAGSPKVPDALLKTGIIQQEQKKVSAAKAAYNRVVSEFPSSSAAIQARTRLAKLR